MGAPLTWGVSENVDRTLTPPGRAPRTLAMKFAFREKQRRMPNIYSIKTKKKSRRLERKNRLRQAKRRRGFFFNSRSILNYRFFRGILRRDDLSSLFRFFRKGVSLFLWKSRLAPEFCAKFPFPQCVWEFRFSLRRRKEMRHFRRILHREKTTLFTSIFAQKVSLISIAGDAPPGCVEAL